MMFTYKHTAEGITKFCKQNKRIYAWLETALGVGECVNVTY
jgi:hypothetical protein